MLWRHLSTGLHSSVEDVQSAFPQAFRLGRGNESSGRSLTHLGSRQSEHGRIGQSCFQGLQGVTDIQPSFRIFLQTESCGTSTLRIRVLKPQAQDGDTSGRLGWTDTLADLLTNIRGAPVIAKQRQGPSDIVLVNLIRNERGQSTG